MNIGELKSVANDIVAKPKGLLAADESSPTIKKRFDSIKVESTEESRRRYRELLFTTEGIERYISGVILYDETLRQSSSDGTPFPTCYRAGESFPASRWTKVQRRWPSIQEIKLLKVWMDCVIVSPNTDSLARDSPSGGR